MNHFSRERSASRISLCLQATGKTMVLVTLISPQTKVLRFMALYTSARREACVKMDHEHFHEGNRFHRVIVKVEKRNGEVVDAIAYKANKECVKGGLKPSEIYLNEILEGEDLFPKEYAAYLRNLKG